MTLSVISFRFIAGLIVVLAVSCYGIYLIFCGLTGRPIDWIRPLTAPGWFWMLAGIILQIPLYIYFQLILQFYEYYFQ